MTAPPHTKEPWFHGCVEDDVICTGTPRGDVLYRPDYERPHFNKADRARIVACVNALASVDDPAAFMAAAKRAWSGECSGDCDEVHLAVQHMGEMMQETPHAD